MSGDKSNFFLSLFLGSYFLISADVNIGFSLKPHMLLCFLIALFSFRLQLRVYRLHFYESVLLMFFCWYCFSALMTSDQVYGLRMVLGVLIFIFCYAISASYLVRQSVATLERALFQVFALFNISSLGAYLMGLIYREFQTNLTPNQILFGLMHDRGMPRMTGILNNPDYFYLTAFISFYFFLFRCERRKSVFFMAAIAALNVILTMSIGAAVAMVAGIGISLVIDFRKNLRNFLKMSFLSVPLIFLVTVSGFAQVILGKRLQHLTTGSGRYAVWETAFDTFMENPIIGIGAYGFRAISLLKHEIVNAHNTFLEILVESGAIGFLLFSLGNAILGFSLLRSFRKIPSAKYLLPSLVTMWISMLSVSATIYPAYLFLLVVASRYLLELRRNENSTLPA